jgi:CDP-diacylglycerol--glycerol-3-phosphate 3-phosphatidyltransferase
LLATIYHTANAGLYMWMPFWVLIIFVTRDLVVTSIRIVAMSEGKVVAAQWSGKIRTAFTMVTVTYYFFLMPLNNQIINIIGIILTSMFALLTVYSMIDYFVVNKSAILKEK